MGSTVHTEALLDIAVTLELKGHQFYSAALEKLDEPGIKQCFHRLSDTELKHAEEMKKLKELCYGNNREQGADYEKAAGCLKAFAEGHAFSSGEDVRALVAGANGVEDLIKSAIVAEKDEIAFYTGLKAFICDGKSKDAIERVIMDEMGHIAELNEWFERSIEGKESV